ncbi:MAG: DUF503 domain-containing protein [Anaerolineae bacterium]|jgi:uncharacterized protein|nr:DUF503 domain-containing protein [Anaerolineae bacterium]MBT7071225.1 DUF503 domain-containing protein [Anaerolineae bacterium]MBT7324192.1 DUF503 domain-containing protein [Anaerolineae bacterium]
MLGILTLHLHIPGCKSLKEKRRRLKPLLTRLHKEFNISVAEMDLQDVWQSAIIGCAVVSNDGAQAQRTLQTVAAWVETNWYDMTVVNEEIEIIA